MVMHGLSDKEVVVMRDKYGNNEISVRRKDGFWNLFLESFGDPIVKILLVVLGIKTIFLIADFDWYETIGIVMSIIVSSFISTISEYGSSRAFERLMNESSKIKCNVIRNGRKISILIDEIVVGDLLILSSGDKIGADGIVIDGEIEVDESLMNGETNSINKKLKDIVYRGCVVYRGNAIVKVDKVGNQTYYGRMVGELGDSSSISPLKERLSSLAVILSKIGYFCAILVSVSYLFERIVISNSFDMSKIISTLTDYSLMGAYLLHALTLGVTIIVVSVPDSCFSL